MKINLMLGTLVMLVAMIAVPTATATSTFYLIPQDSTGTIDGSITVDLMLDVDTTFAGYQLDINFDNSIVDMPASGVTYVWGNGSTTNYDTYTRLVATSDGTVEGTYTIATLTLDGQSIPGTSGLNFSGTMLSDMNGTSLAHTVTNGTYTISTALEPELVVKNIDPSQAIFVDATNVFTVHVENQGTDDVSGSFDVSWQITDDASVVLASGTETITGLNTGEEKTFNFEWKPTVLQNTNVSATADSGSSVTESNETNNDLSVTYLSGTEILPLSDWGYGGDEPLTNYKTGEVIGNLIYTFGDSAYLGGYNNPWSTYTVNFSLGSDLNQISSSIEGVGSGTVQDARLYLHYTWYRTPLDWPADPEQKLTMTFNGNPISTDAKYEDSAGFGNYGEYKYGTFVYNVTSSVTGDSTYQAVLTNDNTTGGTPDTHGTGIYGMALLVIYEDGSKSLKEYCITEGHDLLKQYYKSSSTGRYSYHVVPENVTSTFDLPEMTGGVAKLFTVTHDAKSSPDMSRLYFNTREWSDPWTIAFGSTGTDMEDVTLLNDNPNTVAFQDRGDGYSATNAILISEKEPNLVFAITPNSRLAQVGTPVTIFMSVINAGTGSATDVSISQASGLAATVDYQVWDGVTLIGTLNSPVDIGPDETVNYVLIIDATEEFVSSAMTFDVAGTNSGSAPISGVNTLTIAASTTPYADVIMMSTSLDVSTAVNTATAFALATTNVGSASATGVSLVVDVPSSITGLAYQVNETNLDGSIKGPATGLTIPVGGSPTFAVFLTPTQAIDYDPANNRIMLKLVDGSGKVVGAQSVAVSTV